MRNETTERYVHGCVLHTRKANAAIKAIHAAHPGEVGVYERAVSPVVPLLPGECQWGMAKGALDGPVACGGPVYRWRIEMTSP